MSKREHKARLDKLKMIGKIKALGVSQREIDRLLKTGFARDLGEILAYAKAQAGVPEEEVEQVADAVPLSRGGAYREQFADVYRQAGCSLPQGVSEPAATVERADELSENVEPGEIVLSCRETWELLKISRATFFRLAKAGKILGRIDVPGMPVRYLRSAVVAWLASLASKSDLPEGACENPGTDSKEKGLDVSDGIG